MSPIQTSQLDRDGYVVLERFMSDDLLHEVRGRVDELFEEEGEAAGSEFKHEEQTRRLANLVDKSEATPAPAYSGGAESGTAPVAGPR
jgi:hypothetical protein